MRMKLRQEKRRSFKPKLTSSGTSAEWRNRKIVAGHQTEWCGTRGNSELKIQLWKKRQLISNKWKRTTANILTWIMTCWWLTSALRIAWLLLMAMNVWAFRQSFQARPPEFSEWNSIICGSPSITHFCNAWAGIKEIRTKLGHVHISKTLAYRNHWRSRWRKVMDKLLFCYTLMLSRNNCLMKEQKSK